MEESQAKLQAKLAELEKEKAGSSGTEEDKPAPMEEAEDTPAVAAAPAPAETAPEPEPTKETEAPVVESTTEETKGYFFISTTYREIHTLASFFKPFKEL